MSKFCITGNCIKLVRDAGACLHVRYLYYRSIPGQNTNVLTWKMNNDSTPMIRLHVGGTIFTTLEKTI